MGTLGGQRFAIGLCHRSIGLLRLPALLTQNGLGHSSQSQPFGHRLLHNRGWNGILSIQGTIQQFLPFRHFFCVPTFWSILQFTLFPSEDFFIGFFAPFFEKRPFFDWSDS